MSGESGGGGSGVPARAGSSLVYRCKIGIRGWATIIRRYRVYT